MIDGVFVVQIGKLPRARLANLPTPLEEMPTLTKRLGGPRLLIKRDDETGLGFGGNKTRKLEFIMAEAKYKGADVIVTGAGFQSNWCTQAAAAARKLGMEIVLIKRGPKDEYEPEEYDGNHLLHFILGADIRIRTPEHILKFEDIAEELRKKGHTPYVIPHTGSTPQGAVGYANAMLELLSQANQRGVRIDYIVHATGSGGTQAGLVLGAKALNTGIEVLGILVNGAKNGMAKRVSDLAGESARLLGMDLSVKPEEVTVFDQYVGKGYEVINEEVVEAIKLVAETEGIFLDPVYTGKAMAGLIDLVRKGHFTEKDAVVFLHTGGTPALFPYREPIKSIMETRRPPWTKPPWHS